MKLLQKIIEVMKEGYICDNCLGRITAAQLLSNLTNERRGNFIRHFIAFLIDSGERIEVDTSNFYEMVFRNVKVQRKKPKSCFLCGNLFKKLDKIVERIVKKIRKIEFDTFLIGCKLPDEILNEEERIWEKIGVEYCESIKSEINRELGKKLEKITGKKFKERLPDITILIDLKKDRIEIQIRSLYVVGGYKKLVRGIPQCKWICSSCGGKGCENCNWKGKLYPTSVQEIIEKPLLKVAKGESSAFHGLGREDIDVRCLDFRPFVVEIKKPLRRKINLEEIRKKINKSRKVKVSKLKFTNKETVLKIKTVRIDKTYLAEVSFEKEIDKSLLKNLKELLKQPISQKTPLRVLHRRADKLRKRRVKKIRWKVLGKKKLQLEIRAETGLYIKELITGDGGRTKPNISELIKNKTKKVVLDVIKIHKEGLKL